MTKRNALGMVVGVVLCLSTIVVQAQDVVIENSILAVKWTAASQRLSITAKPRGITFVEDGVLSHEGGNAKKVTINHPTFGTGETIEVTYFGGNRDQVMLFPNLPFALLKTTLANDKTESQITRQLKTSALSLKLGKPASQLKSLGTGGLQDPAKDSGSYVWMTVAVPETRNGVVFGWLTHERGSGVLLPKVDGDTVRVESQLDYGRLRLAPGKTEELETLAIGYFEDVRLGMETWADTVAKVYNIKLRPQPSGYCTWYSSPHGGASDEQHLAELAGFAATNLAPFGFSVVQIDDKWQAGVSTNGPRRNFNTHAPGGSYPSGMKAAADHIKSLGLVPGIWFMPFAGTYYDPLFKEHQEWFVKDEQGNPFETRWGGTCMDMTHPGAREYLRGMVQRIASDWGYQYFKMDGLWTGSGTRLMYVNDRYKDDSIGEGVLFNPDKTHVEAFRDGLKLVRETAGPNVFFLGCCAPQNMRSYGGAFGLVDAMRIGPDNGSSWKALQRGPTYGSRNYFLHGRVWYNDPDPVYIRTSIPLKHAQLICSWVALSGQLNLSSEWLPAMPQERLEVLKRTLLSHGLQARPVDWLENDLPRVWVVRDDRCNPPHILVGAFNWDSDKPMKMEYPLERLGIPADGCVGFDYWSGRFVPPFTKHLTLEVPPESCQIISLRPIAKRPLVVSTSQHVTQGAIDKVNEKWEAANNELTGHSRVVAGDTYELRLVVPVAKDSWDVAEGSLETSGRIPVTVRQNGPEIRASFTPAKTGEVGWKLKFRKAVIQAPPPMVPANLKAASDTKVVRLTWQPDGSQSYRITRNPGTTYLATTPHFEDADVQAGMEYEYEVQGRNWSGAWSEPARTKAKTPSRQARSPAPPAPAVYLSALKPVSSKTGWGKVGVNVSCGGKPLTVDGKVYQKGMGVHANSSLVYAVPVGMKQFVAIAGLDDDKKDDPRSSVIFKVIGDVKEMGEPPVVLAESPVLNSKTVRSWNFNVELTDRIKEVQLIVEDGGDGIAADHADWVEAGFAK